MQPLRRLAWVPALDGLRGLAVLIAYHADALWSSWSGETFELLRPVGGFIGVDLFFVLSGFLLTALLLDRSRGGVKVLDFYLRRALRLVPGLVFALVVYSAVTVRTGEWDLRQVLVSASFLGNWSWKWPDLAMPFALGHLWSVATEAQM
jgi:peptidoglycan/LPS O-acetylase OafA/YrhL